MFASIGDQASSQLFGNFGFTSIVFVVQVVLSLFIIGGIYTMFVKKKFVKGAILILAPTILIFLATSILMWLIGAWWDGEAINRQITIVQAQAAQKADLVSTSVTGCEKITRKEGENVIVRKSKRIFPVPDGWNPVEGIAGGRVTTLVIPYTTDLKIDNLPFRLQSAKYTLVREPGGKSTLKVAIRLPSMRVGVLTTLHQEISEGDLRDYFPDNTEEKDLKKFREVCAQGVHKIDGESWGGGFLQRALDDNSSQATEAWFVENQTSRLKDRGYKPFRVNGQPANLSTVYRQQASVAVKATMSAVLGNFLPLINGKLSQPITKVDYVITFGAPKAPRALPGSPEVKVVDKTEPPL